MKPKWRFAIGEHVQPRKEWRASKLIPSGEVMAREPWGRDGCYRIGSDPHFWIADVLEPTPTPKN